MAGGIGSNNMEGGSTKLEGCQGKIQITGYVMSKGVAIWMLLP